MENNKSADINRWVDQRLTLLATDSPIQPNTAWALARFRSLRNRKSRRERVWGWTLAVSSVAFLFVLALPAPRAMAQRGLDYCFAALKQTVPMTDRPEYAGSKLVRPQGYREWIYLSSGLGMEYNAASGGPENFTNVFVPLWTYKAFVATGKWPDNSMFVLESRASQTKGSINKSGHFQADLAGLAVEVKDESKYANKWAYFSFRGDATTAEAMTGPADACWSCHDSNAAVEHTFVQFYPTLKPVAMKFGTYRSQQD